MKINAKRIQARAINTAAAAGGGILAALSNSIIPSSINPKLKGGIKLLAFGILPELMPKMKWLEPLANGGAGVVGVELAHSFGMDKLTIAGIGEVGAHKIEEDYLDSPIDGLDDPTVNGEENPVH
jgi:hypothetical protein